MQVAVGRRKHHLQLFLVDFDVLLYDVNRQFQLLPCRRIYENLQCLQFLFSVSRLFVDVLLLRLFAGDAGEMRMLPLPFKLQRGDFVRKSSDDGYMYPRTKATRSEGPVLYVAIVLSQSPIWIDSEANVCRLAFWGSI